MLNHRPPKKNNHEVAGCRSIRFGCFPTRNPLALGFSLGASAKKVVITVLKKLFFSISPKTSSLLSDPAPQSSNTQKPPVWGGLPIPYIQPHSRPVNHFCGLPSVVCRNQRPKSRQRHGLRPMPTAPQRAGVRWAALAEHVDAADGSGGQPTSLWVSKGRESVLDQ